MKKQNMPGDVTVRQRVLSAMEKSNVRATWSGLARKSLLFGRRGAEARSGPYWGLGSKIKQAK